MSKVIERLKAEWEVHKGEFVLTQSHKLARFIAIGDDGDDLYWVTYNGREITWNSAVCKLIYLKGKIDDYDYANFIRLAKLNHWDQIDVWKGFESANERVDHHRKAITTHDEGNNYLTDICWDLN
jgi:hypothetical protein